MRGDKNGNCRRQIRCSIINEFLHVRQTKDIVRILANDESPACNGPTVRSLRHDFYWIVHADNEFTLLEAASG